MSQKPIFFRRYAVWIVVALFFIASQVFIYQIIGVFRTAIIYEGHWLKKQKRTVNELYHYTIQGDANHLSLFTEASEYLRKSSQMRKNLLQTPVQLTNLEEIYAAADEHAHIHEIVLFYTYGKNFKQVKTVISAWSEADRLAMQILDKGDEIVALKESGKDQNRIALLTSQIINIDMKISDLSSTYSNLLDQILGYAGSGLLVFNIVFSFGLLFSGYVISNRLNEKRKLLKESYQLILEEFPLHLFFLDKSLNIIQVETKPGGKLSHLTSLQPGTHFLSLFSTADKSYLNTTLQRALQSDKGKGFELSLLDEKTDKSILIQGFVKPVAGRDDKDAALLVLLTDVTEQKQQAEERMQFLRGLDESLNEIYVFDPDNFQIKFMNKGAVTNLQYTEDEWKTLSFFDINLDAERNELLKLKECDSADQPRKIILESKHLKKDGTEYSVEAHIQYLEIGNRPLFLAVAVDIGKRLETEELLRNAFQEQRTLLRETNHRIKNNLNMVAALLSIQASEFEDKKARDMITETVNRLHALMLLHDQLFMAHSMERFQMSDYINSLVSNLVKTFNARDVHFKLDIPSVQFSSFEAIHIGLIVNELVTNALKHGFGASWKGKEKEICISLFEVGKEDFELWVCDNGVGLPEPITIQNPKSLGLRLLSRLTKQLQGNFSASNENGAHFKVMLKTGVSTEL